MYTTCMDGHNTTACPPRTPKSNVGAGNIYSIQEDTHRAAISTLDLGVRGETCQNIVHIKPMPNSPKSGQYFFHPQYYRAFCPLPRGPQAVPRSELYAILLLVALVQPDSEIEVLSDNDMIVKAVQAKKMLQEKAVI